MRYFELIHEQAYDSGKYVAYDLTHETKQKLYDFCIENSIPNKLQLDEFHITLVSSGIDFDWEPIDEIEEEDGTISKSTFSWDLFGDDNNILVLRMKSDFLDERYMDALEAGATSDFPTYKQHISLSYDLDGFDIDDLQLPDFDIVLKNEWQEEAR